MISSAIIRFLHKLYKEKHPNRTRCYREFFRRQRCQKKSTFTRPMKIFSVVCDYCNATVYVMQKGIIIYVSYCRSRRHWSWWKALNDSSLDRIHWGSGKVQLSPFVGHRFCVADIVDFGQSSVVCLAVFYAIHSSLCRANSFVIGVTKNVTNFLVVSTRKQMVTYP